MLDSSSLKRDSIRKLIDGTGMTVTRPVRRCQVLPGKWLGLAGLLTGYAGRLRGRFAVVDWVTVFVPNPVAATVYPFIERRCC